MPAKEPKRPRNHKIADQPSVLQEAPIKRQEVDRCLILSKSVKDIIHLSWLISPSLSHTQTPREGPARLLPSSSIRSSREASRCPSFGVTICRPGICLAHRLCCLSGSWCRSCGWGGLGSSGLRGRLCRFFASSRHGLGWWGLRKLAILTFSV